MIAAFEGLTYEGPSGRVEMKLGKGHQAIQSIAYGTYKLDRPTGQPTIVDIASYPAECVNPPENVKSEEWIKGGFKGATCN